MKRFLITMALVCAIGTAKSQSVPTDNVAAYYPFLGNPNDVSGNGKNCSNTGATFCNDRLGKASSAYFFNGSSNYMLMPTSVLPSSNAFAVSCWLKPYGNHFSSDIYSQVIVDFRGQYQIALVYNQPINPTNPNSMHFYIASAPNSTVIYSPNNSVPLNSWTHVVATYTNNTMSLYINGSHVASKSYGVPSAVSGYNSTIGKDYAIWNNRGWVYGAIDEVIIYKRGLTAQEVQALYNKGLIDSEYGELYSNPNIQYTYDALGRRTKRNVVILKSSPTFISARDSAGMEQAMEQASAFEENAGNYKIIISPNPTKGQLQVEIIGYENEMDPELYLFNLSGKLLISKKMTNTTIPLDLSTFQSGIYILKIKLGDKTSKWKIIKE